MKLKIAIVVHGRFHGFDLARALLRRGHDVTLFTNYPKWAVKRFDFPENRVRSFWLHGVTSRAAWKLYQSGLMSYCEEMLNTMFGRWAAAELVKEHWDAVHTWSGISEEVLQALKGKPTLKMVMRGSAHISTQAELLEEEEIRTGTPQDRPSSWIIAREQREYELADRIVVLSSFAHHSFLTKGVDPQKVSLMPLGASLSSFRPSLQIIEDRVRYILSGQPLRALYVGTLSFQKGLYDLVTVLKSLGDDGSNRGRFRFRFVGPATAEVTNLLAEMRGFAEFVPKQPQQELPKWYAEGDLFVFPTIQDGYAVVLAQANISGLPILTTTNSGGPDLISDGETGWILPIRSPQAFIERLLWCDTHREELAAMVRRIYNDFKPRDWADVAENFESICLSAIYTDCGL
jgi:glycosyltransferase involved in cell wall biosynthesis